MMLCRLSIILPSGMIVMDWLVMSAAVMIAVEKLVSFGAVSARSHVDLSGVDEKTVLVLCCLFLRP